MASNAIENLSGAIGIFGDTIGLVTGLMDSLFPPAPAVSMNTFRVSVGMEAEVSAKEKSLNGNAPALAAWDAGGHFLGQDTPDPGSKIVTGGFRDYGIEGRSGAAYLSVVRTGNDGICISSITGQSANAGLKFVWTGDMGKACGAPWYPQQNLVSKGTQSLVPACVWIDGNGDSGHNWKGFNMHLNSFPAGFDNDGFEEIAHAWGANKDLLCKSEPRFNPTVHRSASQEYADKTLSSDNWQWGEKPPTAELPLGPTGKIKIVCVTDKECLPDGPSFDKNIPLQPQTRRSLHTRQQRREQTYDQNAVIASIKKRQVVHADRLIISGLQQHSAVELCNSLTSLGPDMVSLAEQMFCDMSEKTVWPVCAAGDASASRCFDLDKQTVRGSASSLPATNGTLSISGGTNAVARVAVPSKSYSSVTTWDP